MAALTHKKLLAHNQLVNGLYTPQIENAPATGIAKALCTETSVLTGNRTHE